MTRTTEERMQIRQEKRDSWIAVEEGDTLLGRVTDVTDAWSDQRRGPDNTNGSWYPLITVGDIQEATGYDPGVAELKVHCFGTVLFNEVMRQRPEIGDKVRFTYKGVGEAKRVGQNPPALYTLRVEGEKSGVAERAYGRIESGQPARGGQAAAPGPRTDQGHDQGQLAGDDDIPF